VIIGDIITPKSNGLTLMIFKRISKTIRHETLRALRSNLTLPSGATVRCLPWSRPGDSSTAAAGVFRMRRKRPGKARASRVWVRLCEVLGLLVSGAVGQSQQRHLA